MRCTIFMGAAAIVACALAGSVSAELIVGGNAAVAADGSDITGGANASVLWAWNCNGESDATVNGITFSATPPSSVTTAGSGWSYSKLTNDNALTMAHYPDNNMKQLMGTLLGTGNNLDASMTLTNLTVGQTYVLQVLEHQDIDYTDRREGVIRFGNSTGTALGTVFDHGNDVGRLTTATFIADAASQQFWFDCGTTTDRMVINGAVLYSVVPEPSALTLLTAGMVGLLAYAWRRRR